MKSLGFTKKYITSRLTFELSNKAKEDVGNHICKIKNIKHEYRQQIIIDEKTKLIFP